MKRYFNTKEAALRELETRKKYAIKRIEKRGDKIIGDNSFVYQSNAWERRKGYSIMTDKKIWYTTLGLVTQKMVDDLEKIKPIDYNAELEFLTNEKLRITKKNISSI